MPLTVKQDPANPGSWIWVDSATGQPAIQPGGPGTPFIAQSDNPAAAATVAKPASPNLELLIQAYETSHGKRQSEPSVVNSTIPNPSALPGDPKEIANPNPTKHYTFADGYSLDVTQNGEIVKQVAAPAAPGGTASAQGVNLPGQGVWGPNPADPTGPWIQKVGPATNPDEDITKAIARQTAEGERNAREANAAAGKGYLTDTEAAAIDQRGRQLGQSQEQIALDKEKFANSKLDFDRTQKLAEARGTAEISEAGARTGQIQSAVDIAQKKMPGDIELTGAQTDAQRAAAEASRASTARTNQQLAQGNAPTVENIAANNPYIYQRDPSTGALTSSYNAGFQPKTPAEVASRVAQLQSMAQAQRDTLVAKQQSGAISADEAAQQFDSWWAQNVEPQKAMLDVAQRTAQVDEQQKQQEQNRANYATAQMAGQNAVQAQQALLPYMVGPGFGAALNNIQNAYATGTKPGNIDLGSAVTFQLPDMQALATQATNQALAHISPMAAQNLNQAHGAAAQPQMGQQLNPVASQGMDITQALNRTSYAPTTTVRPDGTVTVTHNQPQPAAPMVSRGSQGAGNPWAGGATPLPGTNWQAPAF